MRTTVTIKLESTNNKSKHRIETEIQKMLNRNNFQYIHKASEDLFEIYVHTIDNNPNQKVMGL